MPRSSSSSWRPYAAVRLAPDAPVKRGRLGGAAEALRRTVLWGTQWGHHEWSRGPHPVRRGGRRWPRRHSPVRRGGPSPSVNHLLPSPPGVGGAPLYALGITSLPSGGERARGLGPPTVGDIWLILPVVICLSQRLSHACLSISNLYGETANGSLNQLSFI